MSRLTGRVAIVTGGGSGIGRATARLFASEGAKVAVADINAASAAEVARNIGQDSAMSVVCDISRETQNQELINTVKNYFGRIDILVSCAARFLMKGGQDAGEADWHEVFATNVAGTALCCRYAAEQMKISGGGAIVIVSSISGMIADPDYATYSASKAALIMLARSLAIDFGSWNVRVNAVSPGAAETPSLKQALEREKLSWEQFQAIISERQCLKLLIQPEDIARCILFLASDEAKVVTGANLVADAGFTTGK